MASVPELAEQIKALKAEHSIDGTPERIGTRRSSAEEPVTARIRRRGEAQPAAEAPALESTPMDRQPTPPAIQPSQNSGHAIKPERFSQERAARGRLSALHLAHSNQMPLLQQRRASLIGVCYSRPMRSLQQSDNIAAALSTQAAVLGLTIESYLENVVLATAPRHAPRLSLDELDRYLDREATSGVSPAGSFSRAELYSDHN